VDASFSFSSLSSFSFQRTGAVLVFFFFHIVVAVFFSRDRRAALFRTLFVVVPFEEEWMVAFSTWTTQKKWSGGGADFIFS